MSDDAKAVMRAQAKATLGTLIDGAPYASLVLTAFDAGGAPLLLLSNLAQHTRNLQTDSHISLLFDGTAGLDEPLTGPRLTVLGTASRHDDPAALAAYVEQQPSAAMYAGFTDFHLYRVQIAKAHFVAGFGQIRWVSAEALL